MPAPFSKGLSNYAPIVNRQGLSAPVSRPIPRPMIKPQVQVRPMAQATNPFAGYQQPMLAPQPMLPPQPFNPYPNPTAGQGAGQMPLGKQFAPQQVQPGFPTPGQTFQQPMPKQLVPQQMQPGYPTPGAAGLNPDMMFAPVPDQQPMPKQIMPQQTQPGYPTVGASGLNPDIMFDQFGPDAINSGSMFNPGSFGMY